MGPDSGELVAYLEGQIGLVGQGGCSCCNSYYTAPVINGPISNVSNETLERMIGLVKNPTTEKEEKEQEENVEA